MMKNRLSAVLIFLIALLSGCAKAPLEPILYWPDPPEEPRIAYLKTYHGAGDFRKRNIFDALFGAPADKGIQKPYGVFAAGDKIYVAQGADPAVVVIDTKERKVNYLGTAGAGTLSRPIGVAVTPDGMVFVSDSKHDKVFGYDALGKLRIAIGKPGELNNPAGIAINNELGRLYVISTRAHTVHVYSLKGERLFEFGKIGGADGEFNAPTNVAIDRRNGNVYIVDTLNFRVQVFDKDGKFIRKFGEVGDGPGAFSRPKGIGIDSEGHVYVVDAAFNNFQVFDENGQILLFVGSLGTRPGFFQLPAGMYVDEKDRIYVADSINRKVQVFQYLSEKWKKEHPEEYKKYLLTEQTGK